MGSIIDNFNSFSKQQLINTSSTTSGSSQSQPCGGEGFNII